MPEKTNYGLTAAARRRHAAMLKEVLFMGFKLNINKQFMKKLDAAAVAALEQTAEALHTEIVQAQVVPRDTGRLQGESFAIDKSNSKYGKVSLVHSTPYARRVYFNPDGMRFHRERWKDNEGKEHDGNPNAKDHWFDDWLPGGEKADFCIKAFKKYYKMNGGL